nr:hypothetical protein [Tanacetum cinerariifolium]
QLDDGWIFYSDGDQAQDSKRSKLFKKIGDNQYLSGGANGVINKPYLSSVNDEGLPTCFQCGESAVVGSKSSSLSCNSNVIDDYGGGHVVDLTKYLKGWSSMIEGSNSNANSPPSIDKGKAVVMQVEDHESKEVQMELDDHESDNRNSDEKQLVITYKCNKQLNKKRKRMKLMNELELES